MKLLGDEDVLNVRIIPCNDGHGRILEQGNATLEVGDLLDAQLAFFRHSSRKSPCILLYIPDVTLHKQLESLVLHMKPGEKAPTANLDLGMELLQVLDDRAINRTPKVRVMIGDDARLVPYIVENVLEASFAEELVPSAERDLDNATKLG